MSILEVNKLRKVYITRFGANRVEALKNVNFSVERGEYVAIMGESGSGKTTLLNMLAALDKPTSGTVFLDGKDLAKIREAHVAAFRRDNLGFVFQDFNLLDTFTLEDNIYLPLVLASRPYSEMRELITPIAKTLGISELLKKYPYEVSGGQKQRVAVARALITNPKIILADEEVIIDAYHEIIADVATLVKEGGLNITHTNCESRAVSRDAMFGSLGGLFFLGIMLSLVFVSATVLIIYYKQISEGYEDQSRFEIMQKVGMTKKDIRRNINSQMFTVFFLPFGTAMMHLGFAFPVIRKLLLLFMLDNIKLFLATTGVSVLVFALFYALVYKITGNSYYGIVIGGKE